VRTAWYGALHDAGTVAWTWTGRNDAGAYVRPGGYRAELRVSRNGILHVLSYNLRLDAFAVGVTPSPVAAGQSLSVVASSSEPLGGVPKVTLTQVGLAPVTRTAVLQPDGRWKAVFTIAAGGTGTATVGVEAKDTLGGTNRSTVSVVVK
jgi:hypothetical protein